MPSPPWFLSVYTVANQQGLDPWLIRALVSVESSNDPWAWNPEPRYRYFWDVLHHRPFREVSAAESASEVPPIDFQSLFGDRDQEWWAQQASWGLMQIMGAVGREMGFDAPYLTQLCDPDLNLTLGCKKLRGLLDWAKGDIEQALAAYNGGKGGNSTRPFRNAAYAAKVLEERKRIFP